MTDVCIYLESHKLKNITSIFKKGQKNSNGNYRSVSILPNISKFTKDIYLNKYKITENIFSKLRCTVLKTSMIEKWKKSVDMGKTFSALLTDIPKAFNYLWFSVFRGYWKRPVAWNWSYLSCMKSELLV